MTLGTRVKSKASLPVEVHFAGGAVGFEVWSVYAALKQVRTQTIDQLRNDISDKIINSLHRQVLDNVGN